MTDDLLTVLVLTYDQRHLVGDTLAGIFAQRTDFPFRVVVNDDASTDGTQEVLEAARRDAPPHITVDLLLQPVNRHSQGFCVIAEALLPIRSEFVALCEGDDFWTDPLKLQRQVDFMRANPWCAVSHHDATILNEGGNAEYEASLRAHLSPDWRTAERVPAQRLAVDNFIMTCTAVLRRAAVRDEVLRVAHGVWPADYMLFCAAAEAGDVGYLPQDMATYRLHGSNSWANASSAERGRTAGDVWWFLSAHLRGPQRHAVQDVLLQMIAGSPDAARAYTAFARHAAQVAELARTGSQVADALQVALTHTEALQQQLAATTRERDLLFRELTRTRTRA